MEKERRVGAAGWASMFFASPLPSQLKYLFIDISLPGLSDLLKKRKQQFCSTLGIPYTMLFHYLNCLSCPGSV